MQPEIHTERVFNAPRERVFAAMTDPDLIPEWWGRRVDTTVVDKMDVRPGGDWRFVTNGPDGENAFRGTYREVSPPERVVQTFEWEGMPGHVIVETAVFEDLGERTKVSTVSLFHTGEERDGMLASGMEVGMSESHEKLDELLARSSQEGCPAGCSGGGRRGVPFSGMQFQLDLRLLLLPPRGE